MTIPAPYISDMPNGMSQSFHSLEMSTVFQQMPWWREYIQSKRLEDSVVHYQSARYMTKEMTREASAGTAVSRATGNDTFR